MNRSIKLFIIGSTLSVFSYCFMPFTSCQISYSMTDSQGVPLDHMLAEIMNYNNGTFIEVGANDGIRQSNTKFFEEYYNWTGILIEPSKNLFSQLCKNRPHSRCFECALGSFSEHNSYALGDFDGDLKSSLTGRTGKPGTQKVLIRSLQSILDECEVSHINFFSLDTEGYELNILRGIDFSRTSFDYLLIEIYKHQYDDIISFLSGNGYDMIKCLTNYNPLSNPHWDGTHNDYLFKKRD